MKGFTLFSGFEGVGIGMKAAGIEHVGGIEYDAKIAQVAIDNGFNVSVDNVLTSVPGDYPDMDWLHASPPCPNFSNAKANNEEQPEDIALSQAVANWIVAKLPKYFTLENVYQYRESQSWRIIAQALNFHGYSFNYWHVNMADYGVPQTRQRMIVIARRDGRLPMLPNATHAENPQAGLFGILQKWIGWYEAIEDLIPALPDSRFAEWQLKRLPEEYSNCLVHGTNGNLTVNCKEKPAAVVVASLHSKAVTPRAFIVGDQKSHNGDLVMNRVDGSPSFVVDTREAGKVRAFIAAQGKYGNDMPVYDSDQPLGTVTANSNQAGIRAFVIDGKLSSSSGGKSLQINDGEATIVPIVASPSAFRDTRAMINGRIVQMTPRALARFQSFPDWYQLPSNKSLACKGIGNAVPPLFIEQLAKLLT